MGENMRIFLYIMVLALSAVAHAESALETDDSFFKDARSPYEDDDLDRAYKKNELSKTIEKQQKTENKVKDEFSTTTPDIMPAYEAQAMDNKIVAENKRRQQAILSRIQSSAGLVHGCVAKNPRQFQGTHATVIWMIGADGRIMDTAIKSTDIDDNQIQKCIQEVAAKLDFSKARTDLLKKTHAEYTYKFKKRVLTKTAHKQVKRPVRKTASQ